MTAKTKRALNLVGAAASLLVAANTALGLSEAGAVRQVKEGRRD